MVPLAEFIELPEDEREGRFPYVWSVDRRRRLMRLLVAEPMVRSCEDRRDFWNMLKAIARVGQETPSRENLEDEVRREISSRIAANIMKLAGGEGVAALTDAALTDEAFADPADRTGQGKNADGNGAATSDGQYMAPWIDTEQCTSCDECVKLNSKIFEYNAQKKAYIKDAQGGPYQDLVKAAERCTARVIHPGLPKDRTAKNIDKWIARGQKYN